MIKDMMARFRRDRRGAAAIEFAILSIPIFLLIMGGVEFGFMMFNKAQLNGTLQQAARMAMTGASANGVDGERIDSMVKAKLKVTSDATVTIEKSHYDSFDQVNTPEDKDTAGTTAPYCWTDINGNQRWDANPARAGLGGPNDIILYKVTVSYPVLFPLITRVAIKKDNVSLSARATLQNEPFGGRRDQQVKKCCMSTEMGNPVTCTSL